MAAPTEHDKARTHCPSDVTLDAFMVYLQQNPEYRMYLLGNPGSYPEYTGAFLGRRRA